MKARVKAGGRGVKARVKAGWEGSEGEGGPCLIRQEGEDEWGMYVRMGTG